MKPAARVGDSVLHGGTILKGTPKVLMSSRQAARVGDPIFCSVHAAGVIVQGSSTVIVAGSFASRVGDMCGCAGVGFAGSGGGAGGGDAERGDGWGADGDWDPKFERTPDGRLKIKEDGVGVEGEHSVLWMKIRNKLRFGEVDVDLNPNVAEGDPIKAKATGAKASSEAEYLPGRRAGFEVVGGEAEGELKSGTGGKDREGISNVFKLGLTKIGAKLYDEADHEILGYKIRIRDEFALSDSSGREVVSEAYRDKKDGRYHLNIGFGGLKDFPTLARQITITPPGAGDADGDGVGQINLIASGDPTVLIG